MVVISQSSVSNFLLQSLAEPDFALLQPHLEPVTLSLRHSIADANKPIKYAYFLDSGVASVVAVRSDGTSIEAGIYGREGLGGIALLLGSDQTPHDHYMQIAGAGHRIKKASFTHAVEQSPLLRNLLVRFVHVFTVQAAQTALANGSASIEERLARWLLMCSDRMDGDQIEITHQFLAMMLCVRRPGVTDAMHLLEGKGLIRAVRGTITIRDCAKLEKVAGASYGLPEAEYRRLIGAF